MSNILVMGGSRFIGKHLLRKLSSEHHITVVNRGSIPEEEYLPEGADQISLDRNDADAVKSALEDKSFDLIFDVSAVSGDHVRFLLDALVQPPKRHVHVSSGSVYDIYGEDPPIFWQPIAEDFPIGRIHEDEHPYMNDKRSAEKVLQEVYRDSAYPMVIVRPTFVYGPDNYIYREAYFFDRIYHDRPLILPNKGHGFQDLVFVDDLADLMIEVSQRPAEEVVGEAFNGTKGDLISANMLAKLIAKIMNKTPEVLYADMDQLSEMQWPPERNLYPYIPEGGSFHDSRKIEQQLGFMSQHTYEEGLEKSYMWWVDHGQRQDYSELEQCLVDFLRSGGDAVAKTALEEVIAAERKAIAASKKE